MFSWNKLCNDSDIKTRWRIVGIDWRTTSVSITNSYLSLQHYKNSERKPLRNNTVAMEFISLCQRDYTAFNKICRHIDFTLRRHRWCIFSLWLYSRFWAMFSIIVQTDNLNKISMWRTKYIDSERVSKLTWRHSYFNGILLIRCQDNSSITIKGYVRRSFNLWFNIKSRVIRRKQNII